MALPENFEDDLLSKPSPQRAFLTEDQGRPTLDWGQEEWLRYRSDYLELIEKVDAHVGVVEELYDTEDDPHEINNLVDSARPEHREALLRLRAALDVWITETGDRGQWPEPPEVVAPFEKEMHEWFGTPKWFREKPRTSR